jgi:hypothetical protein
MVMVNNYFKKQTFGWLTGLPRGGLRPDGLGCRWVATLLRAMAVLKGVASDPKKPAG